MSRIDPMPVISYMGLRYMLLEDYSLHEYDSPDIHHIDMVQE